MKRALIGFLGGVLFLGACYTGLWVYERCKAAELVYQYLQPRAGQIDKAIGR